MKKLQLFLWAISYSVLITAQTPPKLWTVNYDVDFYYNSQTDFSPDSRFYAIGNKTGVVSIYDTSTGQVADSHKNNTSQVLCVAFQPKGNILASADINGSIVFYDYVKKIKVDKFNVCKEAILSITFSADGEYLYAGGKNKQVLKIKVSDGSIVNMSGVGKDNILDIVCVDFFNTLVIATSNTYKGLELYKANNLKYYNTFEISNIQGIDVSPDKKMVAIATLEKNVIVWNLNYERQEFILEGHKKWMGDVTFSSVGDLFASSNDDKSVILWDFKKRQNIASITGKKPFMGIKFSPNGKLLAAMNEDGTLGMWDVSSYLPPTPIPEKTQTTPIQPVDTKKSTTIRDPKGYKEYTKKKELEIFFNENKINTDDAGNVIFSDNNSSDISAPSTPAWKKKIFEINQDLKKYALDEDSKMVISYNPVDSVFKIQKLNSTSKNFDVKEASLISLYSDAKIFNLRVYNEGIRITIDIRAEVNDIFQMYDVFSGKTTGFDFAVKDEKSAELISMKIRAFFAEFSFKYKPIK